MEPLGVTAAGLTETGTEIGPIGWNVGRMEELGKPLLTTARPILELGSNRMLCTFIRLNRVTRLTWLVSILLLLGGCLYSTTIPNDPESVTFVNSLTTQILASGGQTMYGREASPELLRHLSVGQLTSFATRLRATLGGPVGPNLTSGITQIIGGSDSKVTKIAQYTVVVTRQRGTATLTVDATKVDSAWQLTGLVINVRPVTR
jgi:hypothetical protein